MTDRAGVTAAVARTVRKVRTAQGWSLGGLAARAGISEDVLSDLEEGTTSPNLELLVLVADTLGVPLTRLVGSDAPPRVHILSPDDQPVLWHGPEGGEGTLLAGSDPRPSLELWRWRLAPGEARDGAPHLPGNREIAYVDEGTLTLTIDGHRYVVPQGSSAVFVGDHPHQYANEGTTPLHYTIALADL